MKEFFLTIAFAFANNWMSILFYIGLVGIAVFFYYRAGAENRRARIYMRLAIIAIVTRLLFAGVKTIAQYFTWLQTDVSRYLLPPYQSIFVLLRYSWTHFMLNALISIGVALLFFVVLHILRSYNSRYFEVGEVELGFLLALLVGWPSFLVFVPTVFLMIILLSIIRGIFLREPYTTLGLPFFIGVAVAFASASYMLTAMRLTAWVI